MTRSTRAMRLNLPPIYILHYELEREELFNLEQEIGGLFEGGPLVTTIAEAKVVIGKPSKKRRAQIELRREGADTEEVEHGKKDAEKPEVEEVEAPRKKKRKIEKNKQGKEVITIDSSTESEDESSLSFRPKRRSPGTSSPVASSQSSPTTSIASQEDLFSGDTVKVLKLDWYYDSVKAGKLLPITKYLVYEGRIIEKPGFTAPPPPPIIIRRRPEPIRASTPLRSQDTYRHRSRHPGDSQSSNRSQRLALLRQTTSEHGREQEIPPLPAFCAEKYSCQRPTPLACPNESFINELKKIKIHRKLTERPNQKGTQVSCLAYSRAIASIAAYPYTITSSAEIKRLPNCGDKYRGLYDEWRQTGMIREVEEIEADPRIKVLKEFYEIYDVGAQKARSFYGDGLRNLDDFRPIWNTLQVSIQVGLKCYDDFQKKIPREECESIAATILEYANKIRPGYQAITVGGYRRGKPSCGDVDVILTHPEEDATIDFIDNIVADIGWDKWIYHILKTYKKNSNRNQETVSWKGSMEGSGGKGFCTLDKSFLVWQDVNLLKRGVPAEEVVKRRVDIIIAPWKVAGCAIVGWTGGTMFERDIRSYCRHERGVKFDSSGVRRLSDGEWVDLEAGETTLEGKERAVFRGLGLEWREPTERCTG